MELKTLKDMKRFCKSKVSNGTIDYNNLRQEAIKTYKYMKKNNSIINADVWITHFFNLTEKELK